MAIFDRTYGGYRIFVGDLGNRANKYDLEREFDYYGPIVDVWVARSAQGIAFVVYKYSEDAEKACREHNGRIVCGRRVRVEHARPYESRGARYARSYYRSPPPRRSSRYSRSRSRSRGKRRSRSRSHSRHRSRRSRDRRRTRSRTRSRSRSRDRSSRKRSESEREKRRSRSRSRSADRRSERSRSRSRSPHERGDGRRREEYVDEREMAVNGTEEV